MSDITKNSSIKNQTDEHKVFETPEEQILHRPGMWIGKTSNGEKELYIYSEDGFESKTLDFNAGIAKLIEEVIVNSADEHDRTKNNPKLRGWVLSKIKVTVRTKEYEKKLISVTNQPIASDVEFFTNYLSQASK